VLLFRRIDDSYGQPGFVDTRMNLIMISFDETGSGDGGAGYGNHRSGADKSDPACQGQG
jgi:hypothetical protein